MDISEITRDVYIHCFDDDIKYPEVLNALNICAKRIVDKMKCCENCKYNSYWGDELHCNYGLKEATQEDKLVECNNMDKWELKA